MTKRSSFPQDPRGLARRRGDDFALFVCEQLAAIFPP
jgi:hypothetical protein